MRQWNAGSYFKGKNSHVEVVVVESGHKSGDGTDVVVVLESFGHTDMHLVDAEIVEDTIETAADCILDGVQELHYSVSQVIEFLLLDGQKVWLKK